MYTMIFHFSKSKRFPLIAEIIQILLLWSNSRVHDPANGVLSLQMVSDVMVRGLFVVQHREWILNQGSIQSPFVSHDYSTLEPVWETLIHSLLTPTTSHHTEDTSAISGPSGMYPNKFRNPQHNKARKYQRKNRTREY